MFCDTQTNVRFRRSNMVILRNDNHQLKINGQSSKGCRSETWMKLVQSIHFVNFVGRCQLPKLGDLHTKGVRLFKLIIQLQNVDFNWVQFSVCAPMDQCTDPSVALCGWSGLFGFRVLVPSELPLLFSIFEGSPQWLLALKFISYTHICLSYNIIICGNYDIIYKGHDVHHVSINTQTSIDHYLTTNWVSKRCDYEIFHERYKYNYCWREKK